MTTPATWWQRLHMAWNTRRLNRQAAAYGLPAMTAEEWARGLMAARHIRPTADRTTPEAFRTVFVLARLLPGPVGSLGQVTRLALLDGAYAQLLALRMLTPELDQLFIEYESLVQAGDFPAADKALERAAAVMRRPRD